MLDPSSSSLPLAGETVVIFAATVSQAHRVRAAVENLAGEGRIVEDAASLYDALEANCGALFLSEEACSPDVVSALGAWLNEQPQWSDLPILCWPDSGREARERPALAGANCLRLCAGVSDEELVAALGFALSARQGQLRVRDLSRERDEETARRDEFLAMLGHELRNPLAAIRYASELLDVLDEGEGTRAPRGVIARQTRHLARLVDDLLDVARVTRGKITLNALPLDLNDVARKSLGSLQQSRDTRGHTIELSPHSSPLPVRGDALRLEQVFANLLVNALKYTPSGGTIQICLEREDDHARVVVRDSGIGMDKATLPHVFDLFSQGAQNIDRSRGGLGIGLTLVRGLVELHGGRVRAHSDGPGRGSTFEVHLPLRASEPIAAPASPTAANPGTRSILVIEDNDDARELFCLLLRHQGHQVEEADDGEEGLRKLLELRPDIAFVDVGLPELSGYEVARRAREIVGEAVRLIAITGYGQPEDAEQAREAGFDQHLVKPVSPDQVRDAIAALG